MPLSRVIIGLLCAGLVALVLLDGFEALILPRRVTRRYRPIRLFYRNTWWVWKKLARRFKKRSRRESFLSAFGPLSLLTVFSLWAITLVISFAGLQWAVSGKLHYAHESSGLIDYLYLSGATFFTLGFGDVTPGTWAGKLLSIVEAGVGFGFMAVIIGYLPVLYQAFSLRERTISLLDARAGSPPSASEVVARLAAARKLDTVDSLLRDWEIWSAELLESHLSYPVLGFYRSQHDNQSWVAALTAILDSCALLMSGIHGVDKYQAQVTFAMARHAAVDLALVFWIPPEMSSPSRLPAQGLDSLLASLVANGYRAEDPSDMADRMSMLQAMYEPVVQGLAHYFEFTLPSVAADADAVDNWQTSAWLKRTPGIGNLAHLDDGHF